MWNGMFHGATSTGHVWWLLKTIDELYHTTLTIRQKCICVSPILYLLVDNDFCALFVTSRCWKQSQAFNRLLKRISKARSLTNPSLSFLVYSKGGHKESHTQNGRGVKDNAKRFYQTVRSNLGLEAGYIDHGLPYYFIKETDSMIEILF